MKMTPEHWQQLDDLFQAVLDLVPNERQAYLDAHCPDAELRLEIDDLLQGDSRHRDALRERIFSEATRLLSVSRSGEKVGAYTLEQEIGHGGMGTVYLASRSDDAFEKHVAIKILRNKLASHDDQARFKAERQNLAYMEHANIARLLDGGECQDGTPYLVMEYVAGKPINEYVRQAQLDLTACIKLFLPVCEAVQYAHRHQVLHCDIKPNNILVSQDGTAKLVDFGISRLLAPQPQVNKIDHHIDPALALTPAYASPEQRAGETLSERSDIYTLAMVLYEIITGSLPVKQHHKLDSDLQAIFSRALEKDPGHRYPSVSELMADLRHYLHKEPVSAHRSNLLYQATKYLQRKPARVAAGILLCIVAGLSVYTLYRPYQYIPIEVERVIRSHVAEDAQTKTFSVAVLPFSEINKHHHIAAGITQDLIYDLSKLQQLEVIANTSMRQYARQAIDLVELGKTLRVSHLIQGQIESDDDVLHVRLRLIDANTGKILWQRAYHRPAIELFDLQKLLSANIVEALQLRISENEHRLLAQRYTASLTAYDYLLQGLSHYGQRFQQANQLARGHIEKAIALDPGFARAYAVLANTHRADFVNRWSNDPDHSIRLAERFTRKAIELDPDLAQAHFVKGLIHREQRQHSEAMLSAANGIALNPNYADAFILLASVMCYAHTPDDSIRLINKAVRLNPNHPINYHFHMGQCQYVLGKYNDAIQTFERAIDRNPASQRNNLWLAASYAQVGRTQDAKWLVAQLLGWNPALTIRHVKGVTPFTHADDMTRFLQALQQAGLPES